VVPDDHLARAIAAVLDLSWVHAELASYYPKIGRSAAAAAEFIKKKNRRPGPTRSARIPVKRTNKTSLLPSATASRSVAQQNPTATSSLPELVTQNLASATPPAIAINGDFSSSIVRGWVSSECFLLLATFLTGVWHPNLPLRRCIAITDAGICRRHQFLSAAIC
jgi:hypothetical protein